MALFGSGVFISPAKHFPKVIALEMLLIRQNAVHLSQSRFAVRTSHASAAEQRGEFVAALWVGVLLDRFFFSIRRTHSA